LFVAEFLAPKTRWGAKKAAVPAVRLVLRNERLAVDGKDGRAESGDFIGYRVFFGCLAY
jgi:hypothetical protein